MMRPFSGTFMSFLSLFTPLFSKRAVFFSVFLFSDWPKPFVIRSKVGGIWWQVVEFYKMGRSAPGSHPPAAVFILRPEDTSIFPTIIIILCTILCTTLCTILCIILCLITSHSQ
jgi:hypothetical protein